MDHFSQQTSTGSMCKIFLQCFSGAKCNSTGLCYENKVYPLPEFALPLSAPFIQGILLDTFSSPDPRHLRQTPKESIPWCSEQTDDADKAHIGSFRRSFHHAPHHKSHPRHSGIPLMLILKLSLATLQLFHLSQLLTYITMLIRGQTFLCQLLLSTPSFHEGATGPQETEGEQDKNSSLQPWRPFRKVFNNFTLCPF